MPNYIQTTTYAMAIGLGLLGLSGASVQAQTASTSSTTTNADSDSDRAPSGSLEKYRGKLRANELTGANVYNDQGAAIGTVNDLLVGDDGRIENVVLSVGGLLGVGTHYVSVPFNQIQVQPSRSTDTGMATTNGVTGPNGSPTTGKTNTTATPATSTGTTTTGTATDTSSKHYFSVVLPGATKDSLTKMPEYNYRS